jgi:hypothetical protein
VEQIDMYGTALQAIHLVLVLVGLLIIQERWALGVIPGMLMAAARLNVPAIGRETWRHPASRRYRSSRWATWSSGP